MATSYTTLLGFALPATGELDGQWGNVINDSITQLVEDSVAGYATADVSGGNWTLTTTGSGVQNQARCAMLIPTGTPGVSRNIIAPSKSKAYIVLNQSNASVVLKGAATTGVTITAGDKALVAWNGSDFVRVGASAGGSDTQVQYNSSGNLAGSSALTFNSGTGTLSATAFSGSGASLTSLSAANVSSGTLAVARGGTGAGDAATARTNLGLGTIATQAANNVSITGGTIQTTKLQAYTEEVVVANVSGTYNIDLSLANVFNLTLTGNTTFTFTNPPAAGISKPCTVLLKQDATGSRTATFTGAKYTDGSTPVLTTTPLKYDVFTFFTVDGGTSYFGTYAMANVSS